jgi:cytochrome c oxidase subunit 2
MAIALLLAILLITLLCVILFAAHPWWFPAGVSAHAAAMDHQFMVALWLLGGLFVAGHVLLALLLFRSRRQKAAVYSQGSWAAEFTWILAIAALFFWFNASGERLWSALRLHPHEYPHDTSALQVEVTGAQFQWYFRYAGTDGRFGRTDAQRFSRPEEGNALGIDPADSAGRDDIVSSSLILPAGRDVELTLHAQDVIHSLFIPAMRFKQDTVPGMDIHAHFKPVQPGTYEIACSQLCGLGHYRMRAVARVVSEEEFERWLKAQAVPK